MPKKIGARWLGALMFFLATWVAGADGVAVPTEGGVLILNGRTLTEVKSIELQQKGVPRLAVHPSSPILAALSGDSLLFWNLPSFAEASRHQDSLFAGVRAIEFSQDGSSLFLLSPDLRAIIKFDLATSKVVGTLPVPGGDPLWMEVAAEGVVVGQEDSVSLLSPDTQKGLLAQYRFPDRISSAVVDRGRIYLAREATAGLDAYEATTGRAIAFIPTPSVPREMAIGAGGLYTVSAGGEVQAWSVDAMRPLWSYPASSVSFDHLLTGGDGSAVYAFDAGGGVLVSLDASLGQENARINLGSTGGGLPVVFPGSP